ncbi:ABC transporter transmembrane domain-containing protein [Candidatus Chloroploca sp. Khr17]|uniref:ABC transporter transmembrane domain-containing protein n=1 Tax=Candidatus Chloroploca sp. Khr17 TaxID=2496869 RepID=UPI00101CA42E|nr:ABC transporter transmembrane domain-containing protein [Candidatus Chloroploca sp. Khr17]
MRNVAQHPRVQAVVERWSTLRQHIESRVAALLAQFLVIWARLVATGQQRVRRLGFDSRVAMLQDRIANGVRLVRRFQPYLRPQASLIAGGSLALLGEIAMRLLEPWPLKLLVDYVLVPQVSGLAERPLQLDPPLLIAVAALMVLVVAGSRALLAYLSTVALALAGNRVMIEVRADLYRHIQRLSLSYHSKARTGDLINRLTLCLNIAPGTRVALVGPSGQAKLARASQLAAQPGALGVGGLVFDQEQIALYSWPHDQALPVLTRLNRPRRRARLLSELCPARTDLHHAALVHLRYRPERRYVGRLVGAAGGDALLKLYAANDYHLAHRAAESFQSEGPLAIVQPCGASERVRGLIFPWRPDEPLDTLVRDERDDLRAVRLAGAALATLHCQPAPGLPQTALATPLVALDANARTLIALCPELQQQIGRLCQVFAAQLPQSLRHP